MAQITLKQIEAFVHVADLGSFRRAADRLNTTQPNISTRIAGLETQLGVKLMERDAGSVRLSPMGTALLPKARQVMRSVEAFMVGAGDDLLFGGVLRLGVTEMPVHSWLGRFLAALKQRFPNIEVDLTVDYSANLSKALFSRSIDLALQTGPFSRQISGTVDLGRFSLAWVAAPSLGLGRRPLSLSDLSGRPILTHARGTLPYEQLAEHLGQTPEVAARLVPSTNMSACIQMTVEGLGVACLPAVMVAREIADGQLEALNFGWSPDPLNFSARYDAETAPHYVIEAAVLARDVAQDRNY